MNFRETMSLLDECIRSELRDHAFGDVEIYWTKNGEEVAFGYFSGETQRVFSDHFSFTGQEAKELRHCGTDGNVERNDETGPDEFVQGQTMPSLMKKNIFDEITKE